MNDTMLEREVANYPAGKELDAKMYATVFRWNLDELQPDTIPNYSVNICAAMRVLEYLKNTPFQKSADYLNISYVNGKWLFEFRGFTSYEPSLATAITKVALMYGLKYLPYSVI
jgi:hypothetical protein